MDRQKLCLVGDDHVFIQASWALASIQQTRGTPTDPLRSSTQWSRGAVEKDRSTFVYTRVQSLLLASRPPACSSAGRKTLLFFFFKNIPPASQKIQSLPCSQIFSTLICNLMFRQATCLLLCACSRFRKQFIHQRLERTLHNKVPFTSTEHFRRKRESLNPESYRPEFLHSFQHLIEARTRDNYSVPVK